MMTPWEKFERVVLLLFGNCTYRGSFILETLLTSVYSWTNNSNPKEK
jgi:hypothetical protein